MTTWIPEGQHGYSIALCECEGGPHLGARQMGTPCVCERCLRITPDQWDFLVRHVEATALADLRERLEVVLVENRRGTTNQPWLWDKVYEATRATEDVDR